MFYSIISLDFAVPQSDNFVFASHHVHIGRFFLTLFSGFPFLSSFTSYSRAWHLQSYLGCGSSRLRVWS